MYLCQEKKYNNAYRILERVRLYYNLANGDKALADFFDVEKTTISAWRQRNSIPEDKLIKSCGLDNLKLILTGEGPEKLDQKDKGNEIQPPSANQKHAEIYALVKEILESGDDWIIQSFRDRLRDYRLSLRRNAERRRLEQLLIDVQQRISSLEKRISTPGEADAPDGTDASGDTEKKAM